MFLAFFTETKFGRALASIAAVIAGVAAAFFVGWFKRGSADTAAAAKQEVNTLRQVDRLQSQAGDKTDAQLANDLTRPGS